MFWRLTDPQHPRYDAELAAKYGDAIELTYERMDAVVGDVMRTMKPDGTLIIVSDHGFHSWRKGFNTNTWLVKNGFMTLKNPGAEEKQYNLDNLFGQGSFFPNTDWSRTQAYAVGLGQVYLNLRGREKYGIVNPGADAHRILDDLRQKLLALEDPDTHEKVIENVYFASRNFPWSALERGGRHPNEFSRWLSHLVADLAGSGSGGHHRGQHEKMERRPLRVRPQRYPGDLLFQPAIPCLTLHFGYLSNRIEPAGRGAACPAGWPRAQSAIKMGCRRLRRD